MLAEDIIQTAILKLVKQRGLTASACPSEVARTLSPDDWRELMPQVREAASLLALQDKVQITQRGKVVSGNAQITGPIRIRLHRP